MIQLAEIEKKISGFSPFRGFHIDQVLFEADYPVLFSGIIGHQEYLLVCPVANRAEMVWLAVETSRADIISMLENRITIREAFTTDIGKKYLICYDGASIRGRMISLGDIPDELLPSPGEYMEAEDGEYDEEIEYYRSSEYMEKIISLPKSWIIYPVTPQNLWISITADSFELDSQDMHFGKYWSSKFMTARLEARMEA